MATIVKRATKGSPLTTTELDSNFENLNTDKVETSAISTFGGTLIDDADAAAARTTLGLGTAATTASTDYATAAQGSTADSALQDITGESISDLSDVVITTVADNDVIAYDSTTSKYINQSASEAGLATSAQGTLADSAVQPGDNVSDLTNDSGFITGNQTITLSGDVTGSGTTSITATVANDSHSHTGSTLSGIAVSNLSAAAVQTSAEAFSDSDTVLMTAAAVADKIESYGYTTQVGDITGVTASTGLTGGGTSGTVSLAVSYGTAAGTACQGNDSRLSNSRTCNNSFDNAATARTNLGLGSLATLSAVGAAQITDNTVGAAELNVTGNGTTSQFLRSDGDGTFTWATPTDTNTTYSAGSGLSLSGTTFTNTAPDQTVTLTGSGATSISGTYPNFTISSTDTNTNTTYSAGSGLDLTGTTFSVEPDLRDGITHIGYDSGDYIGFSNNTQIDFYINASNEFRFTSAGTFHADGDVVAYSTTTASDERLKDNISVVDDALSKVCALNGVTFKWKKDGTDSAGVIAQEVMNVLPQAVKEVNDLKEGSHLAVNYGALTSILIEAIKELSAEVEALKGAK